MPGASDESADGGEEQKSEEDEVKVECENSRAQYSCLVFSRSVGSNPDDVAAAISVRRTSDSSGAPVSDEDTTTYPALVQDKKVCYGLEFGASYKFIVDQSLKSASGESLDKKTVARLKMPDKGSLLGFKRGTYVLPKVGERSITIDTVNTKRAQLMLRRIGDRNLVREILLDHIVKGFADNSEESCFVLNEASERIADGSVTLPAPQSSRNQSIPLTLPIDTILETRRQWLVEDPSAKERTLDLPVKDAKLSFDLRGDPAAATLASKSGVFALFGTITEPLIDDAAVKGDAFDEETCADRRYASQWFIITDTGLTLQTSHKYLYVIARSLSTTRPLKDVKIELVSRGGLVLATNPTDKRGVATFPAKLGEGTAGNELVAVMAYNGEDFSFLDKTASHIDLADRGFEGGVGPEADVDAFVAPIRAIFRPGNSVEGLVLIRDLTGQALDKVPPFELQLIEEDGGAVLAAETVNLASGAGAHTASTPSAKGGYRFSLRVPPEVRQGTAKVVVSVAGRVAGSSDPIQIRYFQPYTVAVQEIKGSWSGEIDRSGIFTLKGDARADYLYGHTVNGHGTDAPASGLPVKYEVRLVPAELPLPGCFAGFTFGRAKDYLPELFSGGASPTGEDGSIHMELVPSHLTQPQADIPLKAVVTLEVLDANSVASTQQIEVPVKRIGKHWIGAKVGGPQALSPNRPDTNALQSTEIQIVALDPDGKPEGLNIPTSINRINNTFVWSFDGRGWDYVPDPGKSQTYINDVVLSYDLQLALDSALSRHQSQFNSARPAIIFYS